ncbi:MAG: hypothetical protein QOE07_2887, partial [Acidimicrobiaceae bacterium]|nr:hypothetical protein [Acidimicrobiaceae bacterium]
DPRAELEAAHRVLQPGGHLLIEVPDPESRFARLMGRYWVPWLQPQHQFVPVANLCTALEAQDFSVVEVERGPAHQPVDLGGGTWMWAARLAPPPRLPWRDAPTTAEGFRAGGDPGGPGPVRRGRHGRRSGNTVHQDEGSGPVEHLPGVGPDGVTPVASVGVSELCGRSMVVQRSNSPTKPQIAHRLRRASDASDAPDIRHDRHARHARHDSDARYDRDERFHRRRGGVGSAGREE